MSQVVFPRGMLNRGNGMEERRLPRAMLPVLAGVIEFTQNQCNESENGFMDKVGCAAFPRQSPAHARSD